MTHTGRAQLHDDVTWPRRACGYLLDQHRAALVGEERCLHRVLIPDVLRVIVAS
ncbi:hypothetical protein [Mycolicibacterium holsaticum]|uniref:hypothetical protein n=1 Tax=Mycolicibacterium holsaticum TaxID=152142 RepID=UPI001F18A740|nr:hypothetical protein [Mycolicibacterium holsaticum]